MHRLLDEYRLVQTEEAPSTSERVAAFEPNDRCLDGARGSKLKSTTPIESTEVIMTSTDVRTASSTAESAMPGTVDMKLEVVILPVSDSDRAKRFYQKLGWRLDADFPISDDFRVLQFTPTGSQASIIFGTGVSDAAPGSAQRLLLVVQDIEAARADLVARGVDVSEVFHGAGFRADSAGRIPGPDPERRSYSSFATFSDPDGNGWMLQEITQRLPGR
jgi:catechol 2,3-dioxygenase-like lactoylglutathione lyase family enzyme